MNKFEHRSLIIVIRDLSEVECACTRLQPLGISQAVPNELWMKAKEGFKKVEELSDKAGFAGASSKAGLVSIHHSKLTGADASTLAADVRNVLDMLVSDFWRAGFRMGSVLLGRCDSSGVFASPSVLRQ